MQSNILSKQLEAFTESLEGGRGAESAPAALRLVHHALQRKQHASVSRRLARRGVTLDSGIFKPFTGPWS
jgi:hypothetical protein